MAALARLHSKYVKNSPTAKLPPSDFCISVPPQYIATPSQSKSKPIEQYVNPLETKCDVALRSGRTTVSHHYTNENGYVRFKNAMYEKGIAVLAGPVGSGKTSSVERLADEQAKVLYRPSEGALDLHEIRLVLKAKKPAAIVLIDDADQYLRADLTALLKIQPFQGNSIALTTSDPNAKVLRNLFKSVAVVNYVSGRVADIARMLMDLGITQPTAYNAANNCLGDFRKSIIMARLCIDTKTDDAASRADKHICGAPWDVFECVARSESPEDAEYAFSVDRFMNTAYTFENQTQCGPDIDTVLEVAEMTSSTDMLNVGFLHHYTDLLMGHTVHNTPPRGRTSFPQLLGKTSSATSNQRKLVSVTHKLGALSDHTCLSYLRDIVRADNDHAGVQTLFDKTVLTTENVEHVLKGSAFIPLKTTECKMLMKKARLRDKEGTWEHSKKKRQRKKAR
tara:strand:- start:395 stop:1747 length:1353 start_codon:yes stop_codon:yes gene_type:complete